MAQPACEQPFERGGLCNVCRMSTMVAGLKRCSKMVAESAPMHALMLRAVPIATTDASVIIHGESGTGKEILARALHANSPRRKKAFIAVNVAALPSELLESELFGHARGAFTGAVSAREGLMVAAHEGTLFLDEIAEMPLPMQAKLLRALQDGEVRPVGDSRSFSVDARIICATHRDLVDRVERGLFREDLYYRLKVFSLTVPALRDRRADLLPLARQFLELEGQPDAQLTPEARRALEDYKWPGNVRELANAIKHAAVLAQGATIDVAHLPEELTGKRRATRATNNLRPLAEVEKEHVLRVLEACGGNQVEAARVLGIGRNTLWRKLRVYDETGAR